MGSEWFRKGKVWAGKGRYEKAITCYNLAIELNSEAPETYYALGFAHYQLNHYPETIQNLRQAMHLGHQAHADVWFLCATSLTALAQHEEAILSFDQALIHNPQDICSYWYRGNILCHLHHYEEAIASYDQALSIKPKSPISQLIQIHRMAIALSLDLSESNFQSLSKVLEQLTESDRMSAWDYEYIHGLQILFDQYDFKTWQIWIIKIVKLFKRYDFIEPIKRGLLQQTFSLLSHSSQSKAEFWREAWYEAVGRWPDWRSPISILNAVVSYKKDPYDPKVTKSLSSDDRSIFEDLLNRYSESVDSACLTRNTAKRKQMP